MINKGELVFKGIIKKYSLQVLLIWCEFILYFETICWNITEIQHIQRRFWAEIYFRKNRIHMFHVVKLDFTVFAVVVLIIIIIIIIIITIFILLLLLFIYLFIYSKVIVKKKMYNS